MDLIKKSLRAFPTQYNLIFFKDNGGKFLELLKIIFLQKCSFPMFKINKFDQKWRTFIMHKLKRLNFVC